MFSIVMEALFKYDLKQTMNPHYIYTKRFCADKIVQAKLIET